MILKGKTVLVHFRPLIRLIRKRIFLLFIFTLSLTYCIVNLLNDNRSSSSMSPSSAASIIDTDYIDSDVDIDSIKIKLMKLRRGSQMSNYIHDTNGSNIEHVPGDAVVNADIVKTSDFSELMIDKDTKTCRNSVQGKVLIADDKGYICHRKHVTPGGCCNPESQSSRLHSCETCQESSCCSIYEYCISCCMEPEKKPLLQRILSSKTVDGGGDNFNVLFASITDHFEFCLAKCRTSSLSVQHENSYRDPKAKHCYGETPVAVPAVHGVVANPSQSVEEKSQLVNHDSGLNSFN